MELLEMDSVEWIRADHFPPLSSSRENLSIAMGLPKHSQPDAATRVDRIKHTKVPPIALVDESSNAVGNLPLHFTWESRAKSEVEAEIK
jgi:hypothetical protein